jgi:hypothetical protein
MGIPQFEGHPATPGPSMVFLSAAWKSYHYTWKLGAYPKTDGLKPVVAAT